MAMLPEDPTPAALSGTGKTPGHDCWGPGCMPSRVTRSSYSAQMGGEILFVHSYRDGREDRYGSGMGLVLFRLVIPPLQLGGVGPYLARSE
jgi:hypothetical protein